MVPTARILLVEDDPKVARTVRLYLEAAGYEAVWVEDGREAVELVETGPFDLVVLDLMLPGLDGHAVCRRLREGSRIPIIMLTARTTEDDRIRGLDLGADDYVAKPFSPRELLARIRAVLRRAETAPAGEVVRAADLVIDPGARTVERGGRPVALTATELEILATLARHPGRTFTRSELIERIEQALGKVFEGSDRTVDAHVKNLRRALEPDPRNPRYVQTVFGVGYRFGAGGGEGSP
ncbi:MAG: response regulator transcription factor [Acidobacteriota bacterium]|jgi:DNA-binding response OmpR family regulator